MRVRPGRLGRFQLSALRFHGLTSQAPFAIWLAIENKATVPGLDCPPLRIVHFSGAVLTEGVEDYIVDGVSACVASVMRRYLECIG